MDGPGDGPTNMGRDAELLAVAEQGTPGARIYSWSQVWVTLGRFQRPERALQPGFLDFTIRPTGGRAVLHGHDVTVGLAVPLAHLGLATKQTDRAYRLVVSPIVQALRDSGLGAQLVGEAGEKADGTSPQDCFALAAPTDVVDRRTGLKVCGCALLITDTAVLAQCSIPVAQPLVDPKSVICGGVVVSTPEIDAETLRYRLFQALSDAF